MELAEIREVLHKASIKVDCDDRIINAVFECDFDRVAIAIKELIEHERTNR